MLSQQNGRYPLRMEGLEPMVRFRNDHYWEVLLYWNEDGPPASRMELAAVAEFYRGCNRDVEVTLVRVTLEATVDPDASTLNQFIKRLARLYGFFGRIRAEVVHRTDLLVLPEVKSNAP